MDIVSFETAKRLKEAGFPQPDPEVGQTWYSKNGNQFIVFAVDWKRADMISETSEIYLSRFLDDGDMIFAPTAIDLLRRFDGTHVLGYSLAKNHFYVSPPLGRFTYDKNPAEALSQDWLSCNFLDAQTHAAQPTTNPEV